MYKFKKETQLVKLLKSTDDYCIVGNSPMEIGKENGDIIDSKSLIVRFNDFKINDEFVHDYGERTNVWIRGTNDKLVYTMEQKKTILGELDLVIVRAKDDRNIKFRSFMDKRDLRYEFLPLEVELSLTHKLGCCPSTGLIVLYMIYLIKGSLNRDNIFGFSFCKENRTKKGTGGQIHYYNRNDLVNPETKKVEKIKKTFLISKHQWAKEERFFKLMLKGEIK